MVEDKEQRIETLQDRVDELEATVSKMLPSRRDALKLGAAGAVGAVGMAGSASAQNTNQVGTIGTDSDRVDVNAEDIDAVSVNTDQATTGGFGIDRPMEEIFFEKNPSSIPQLTVDWSKFNEIIILAQASGGGSTVPVIADFGGVGSDGWDITQRSADGTFSSEEGVDLELHTDIRNVGAGLWHILDNDSRYLAFGNGSAFTNESWMVNANAAEDTPPSSDTLDLTDALYYRLGVWGVE